MQLLELIPLTPALKLLEVTSALSDMNRVIAEHVKTCDAGYNIALYPCGEAQEFVLPEWVRLHRLPNTKVPFPGTAREFEIIILRDVLDIHMFPKKIMQLAYRCLENSGELIIIQKKSAMALDAIKEMVEACDFRAVNDIDLFEDHYVVTAKKMHMWGNGL